MGVVCILQGVQRFLLLSLVTHAITSVLLLLPRKTESWCSVQTISKIECFLWYMRDPGYLQHILGDDFTNVDAAT